MNYPKILTIQDISCYGQCSLTVALPILSACGVEAAILPSAVLSTHTAGFTGFTFRDLTDDMPLINEHWKKEGIFFDAIYTGYLGSARQIEIVKEIAATTLKNDAKLIVDPAMADNGSLYPGFDTGFVKKMKKLVDEADLILPNITEASLLCGMEYKTEYDMEYIEKLCKSLDNTGDKTIILTGVSFKEDKTGVIVYENGSISYYEHKKFAKGSHGTGDVFASAFVGAYVKGNSAFESAKIAADYTVECIGLTTGDKDHEYGVKFELALPVLMNRVNR